MTTHRCQILLGRRHDAIRLTILSTEPAMTPSTPSHTSTTASAAELETATSTAVRGGTPNPGLEPWALAEVPAARAVLFATTDYGYLHAVTELVTAWNTTGLGWAQSVDDALAPLADPNGGYVDVYDPAFGHTYGYEGGHVWWRTGRAWRLVTPALLDHRQ